VPEKQVQTVDLRGEYIEHIHLLDSFKAGWDSLHLIYEQEPAGEMPENWLDRHMLVICLGDFQASYLVKGSWQHQSYTEGDLAIFPANELFPRSQIDRQVGLIELFLEPIIFTRLAYESVNAEPIELLPLLKFRDPLIQQIGLALKTELEAGETDSRLYADSMATALCLHLLKRYSVRKHEIKDYTGGLPHYKLKQAIAYINENLEQNLSLTEIATVLGMSSHYFATLFKQSMGIAPHQYVTKCRIEQAKQLLAKRELTIVEICHQIGYQSQSHFTRVFRQYTKTTPKAYREKI
jgi:AraC family transcriptional regulator